MRIIAGRWRGHPIAAPQGRDTRPTSGRVREAIFSAVFSLAGGFDELRVLDLYAGSGALGLEALSRGAEHATFVEADRRAADAIRENLRRLGVGRGAGHLIQGKVERLVTAPLSSGKVSLLLADPPYRIDAGEVSAVLASAASSGLLEAGALVVWEHATGAEVLWPEGYAPHSVRRYGDTSVSFAFFKGEAQ